MEKQISSAVAAAAVGLAACLAITIPMANASPISWGNAGVIAGDADLIPAASNSAATNALFAIGSTSSGLLLECIPSDQQTLLGTFGYLQGMVSPGRMTPNGADLMPLYEHSIQGRGLDPRTEYGWLGVGVGIDTLQVLALKQTQISAGR